MRRIDTDRATVGHLYQAGDPGVGLLPTALSARGMNNLQEEICSVIEAAGLTVKIGADADNFGQLLAAINVMLANTRVPIGTMAVLTGVAAPDGWLIAGQTGLLRAGTYAALWNWVVTLSGNLAADDTEYAANPGMYGPGDGVDTFDLPAPDFVRRMTGGRDVGSFQADAFQGFKINVTSQYQGGGSVHGIPNNHDRDNSNPIEYITCVPEDDGTHGAPRMASETRPANTAYPFIIKF